MKKKAKKSEKLPSTFYTPLNLPKLPLKRKLFIELFVKYKNAAKAYREAYRCENLNVSAVEGHRLLSNPNIRNIIQSMINEEYREQKLTRELVIKRMREFAMEGPRDRIATHSLELLTKAMGIDGDGGDDDSDEEVDTELYAFVKVKPKAKKKNGNKD